MTRTVVITGGGTGIGRAVAAAFASDGAAVVITGRRADVLDTAKAELGGDVRTVVCDSSDVEQVEALAASITGRVDVLVNNAGGNRDLERGQGGLGAAMPAAKPSSLHALAQAWRANLESNLISAVITTAALSERLATGGAVINIGSFAADRGAGSYGAAKAGMASWNIGLARELGARDITANVVVPGYIADTEFFRGRMSDEFHAARVAETMTKRAGCPDDIAGVVQFLASPAARQITGQVINVNGGALTTR
ncbi:SDR family NAD(P)-dependent oxidoreductase [Kibdelosporangium aridum]|uniref:SDR family NAD(P)-dependent oxidoreductase n=1 Tax=Kibdelosporangium aridum TaxID=2030 RepID=UPI00052551A7